jgi:group I intron endonuclease
MIIYCATDSTNGKKYVGQTKYSIAVVKRRHRRCLSYFGYALARHGEENFIWEILDTASSQEELNEKEIQWIDKLNTVGDSGYNLAFGGESNSGWKHSEETKEAISLSLAENVYSRSKAIRKAWEIKSEENGGPWRNKPDPLKLLIILHSQRKSSDLARVLSIHYRLVVRYRNYYKWRYLTIFGGVKSHVQP